MRISNRENEDRKEKDLEEREEFFVRVKEDILRRFVSAAKPAFPNFVTCVRSSTGTARNE